MMHCPFTVCEKNFYPVECLICNPEAVTQDLIEDPWSTLSKAAEKSNNISTPMRPWSSTPTISLCILTMAVSVC
jgi:hypothetical protein